MHVGEHRKNSACRACKGTRLAKFLDLGLFPAVNNMLTKETLTQNEPHYPLEVYFCQDCNLVQLIHIVPPEVLFSHYVYLTATSSTMVAHLKEMTNDIHKRFLSKGALAVDIGSNDGTLLKGYPSDVSVLGIEPAQNVANMANHAGVRTVAEFFNEETAKNLGKADVITATNVFAHIDDWDSVIRGVDAMLKEKGVFVIEAPYLVDFIEGTEFDTVYHEHLSYISIRPLVRLFERFGMEVFDVLRTRIHGGSVRVFVARKGKRKITKNVGDLVALEKRMKMDSLETYKEFAVRVESLKTELTTLLKKLKYEGKRIVGYGAAAKGTVLLNYFKIGPDVVTYVVDKNSLKQGLYIPGMKIPVYGPQKLMEDKPDYVLLLVWNIADEVMKEQSAFADAGGKFIIPIPKPKIV